MLLQCLSGDVEGQVVRVHHSLDEVQVFGHHVLKVMGDENSPDVELNCKTGEIIMILMIQ